MPLVFNSLCIRVTDGPAKFLKTVLLIDFENVRTVSLASLPTDIHVLIFVGKSQHSIPFEITRDAQLLGSRLEWIKIEGDGRNNLDFHLACHLGRLSNTHPDAEFLVLSKDKGFDPLIKHLVGRKVRCRRIEILPSSPSADGGSDPHFEKIFKILSGIEKKARPRKRKTLLTQVASFFQKKEKPEEIVRIVERFFEGKLITEANNALTYNF